MDNECSMNPCNTCVIVNYTLKYNHNIPIDTVYSGNIMKCCILRKNSMDPTKNTLDGDTNHNCLPARIILYANSDQSATPVNPGKVYSEGTRIRIPDQFDGIDITRMASFVKCYTDQFNRKTKDLIDSAIQLNIRCKVLLVLSFHEILHKILGFLKEIVENLQRIGIPVFGKLKIFSEIFISCWRSLVL